MRRALALLALLAVGCGTAEGRDDPIRVRRVRRTIEAGDFEVVSAGCRRSEDLVGGGYAFFRTSRLRVNASAMSQTERRWVVHVLNEGTDARFIEVQAYCLG